MHKVSVIIPIYNVEDYLPKCLESVINQTYKNLEIICVDDCSPDNSSQILKEYENKDKRIKIVNRKQNGGLSAARNSGMDVATGEYIYFLDSDDWIDLDYIEKMVQAMEESEAEIVINTSVITEKETSSAKYMHPTYKKEYKNTLVNNKVAIENIIWNAWAKMLKTDFLKKCNLFFPEGYINEDLYFHYTSLAFAKRIFCLEGSNYHYLSRTTSISTTEAQKDIEILKIYNLLYDYYKEHDLLDIGVKIFSVMPFYNINNEEKYNLFKQYFSKTEKYLKTHSDLYNGLELFFMNNILSTKSYTEYIEKFTQNVTISYIKHNKNQKS